MKIECPKCGQHYEVEANLLDRHFRCTECKTFFLGINAKTVKNRKFVRKDELDAKESSAEAEKQENENKLESVEKDIPAEKNSGVESDAVSDDKAAESAKSEKKTIDASVFEDAYLQPVISNVNGNSAWILGAVGVILGAAALVVLLIGNSKRSELLKVDRNLLRENKVLRERVEQLDNQLTACNTQIAVLNNQLQQLGREQKEMDSRVRNNSRSVEKIEQLDAANNKFENKLNEFEAQLTENANKVAELEESSAAGRGKRRTGTKKRAE